MGENHKEGLEALGKGVGEGLRGLGDEVKTGLEVFAISLSISVIHSKYRGPILQFEISFISSCVPTVA